MFGGVYKIYLCLEKYRCIGVSKFILFGGSVALLYVKYVVLANYGKKDKK